MPWGVPTGRLNGILDDSTPPIMPQPDIQAPTLGILGSVARPDIAGAMKAATTPSFFGQGGVGRNIAGYIGDALQRLGGGQGTFAQAQALQRQQDYQTKQALARQQLEEQQYQRHRGDTMADWKTQHQWSLDNAEPTGMEAQIAALKKNGATDADIQTFVHNKIDPVHMATGIDANGNTILTPYRASQFGTPGGPPPAAVAHLKLHPELAPSFEAKFGKGSAARYLNGGATPPASGTFPQASGDSAGRGGGVAGLTIERNNNPGALRVPGSQTFQRFGTPQQGVQAQEALLQRRYLGKGLNTVSSIVETYAPRLSRGGDNTDAQVTNYTNYVARRLGIGPDQPISPSAVPQLAAAMREFETGKRGS